MSKFWKLRCKIHEICCTEGEFARRLGISHPAFTHRITGKTPFSLPEVERAVEILGIAASDIPEYFFTNK